MTLFATHIIDQQGQHTRRLLVCCDGRYSVWLDRLTRRVRWALREWPDDGSGVPTHGQADDLEAAVNACHRNAELRKAIT